MDTAQSPQQPIKPCNPLREGVDSRMKPHKEQGLNCPRCTSTNTKFCYYNNYSLSQPRYFCKTCKRYWTEGGFLRNVPVGGGSRRKNKRSSSSTTKLAASASSSLLHAQHRPEFNMTLSKNSTNVRTASCTQQLSVVSSYESTIPFGTYKRGQVLNLSSTNQTSALDLLRSEISARMLDPFVTPTPMPMPMPSAAAAYGDGFGFQELKRFSNLKPWDEVGAGGYGGNMQDMEGGGGGGLLFPFEDLKQAPINNDSGVVMENGTETTLFWNGVMGRGGGGGGEGSW